MKWLLAILFMLSIPLRATIVSDGSNTVAGSATSWSMPIDVASASNRILLVHVGFQLTTITAVLSISRSGQAFTRLVTADDTANKIELWYLLNPAAGPANITATAAGSVSGSLSAICYTGVNQSTPFGVSTTVSDGFNAGNLTVTVSSTVANSYLLCEGYGGGINSAITSTSGMVSRANISGSVGSISTSDINAITVGSYTAIWKVGATSRKLGTIVELIAATTNTGPKAGSLMTMGIGR